MPELILKGTSLSPAARQTPRVIVPIMAATVETARKQAQLLSQRRWDTVIDLIELRLDPLIAAGEDWLGALGAVHEALSAPPENARPHPLLATIRTRREGGLAQLTPEEYGKMVQELLTACPPELVDIEFSAGPDIALRLRDVSRSSGVFNIFSKHDFNGTPTEKEMVGALCAMAADGADVVKLAVTAKTPADANTLLSATRRAAELRPNTPRITMSMGPHGTITRVCGGLFGSCATFGSVGKESAPGQIEARTLRRALNALGRTT